MNERERFQSLEMDLLSSGEYHEKAHLLERLRFYDAQDDRAMERSGWFSASTAILGGLVLIAPTPTLAIVTMAVQIIMATMMFSSVFWAWYCKEKREQLILRIHEMEDAYDQPIFWRWIDAVFCQKSEP